jgi:hypothetical protein
MDYGIQNRVIGYSEVKPVKRVRKFIAPNGQEFDGGIEAYRAYMAGVGRTDSVPKSASKS